jgi:hypothetical protein
MVDRTVDLDKRRGIAAQKATSLRRLLSDVKANEKSLRLRQEALEAQLIAAPAATWAEAAEKARYLLGLYVAGLPKEDTRQRELVAAVLADFQRLSRR